MYVSVCWSVCQCFCLSVCLSVCQCVCLFVYQCVCLFVFLSILLSGFLFLGVSVHLSVSVSVHVSVSVSVCLSFLFSSVTSGGVCCLSGLCTHYFPLSERCVRLRLAVGLSLVVLGVDRDIQCFTH